MGEALAAAKRLYDRAAAVGLRQPMYAWDALPAADRERWLALAESAERPPDNPDYLARLVAVEQLLQIAIRKQDEHAVSIRSLLLIGEAMSAQLDRLEQSVRKNSDVIDSAITLIKGLAEQVRQLKDEPEKLVALADKVDAKAAALAAAVTENTPAAPQPAPPAPNP